jgi:uncharacterized protein YyaL (SSP411 family)
VEEAAAGLSRAERALLDTRSRRPRPQLDYKILTSWNGLMISAFALAGAALNEPRYAEAARHAADFILNRLYNSASGLLLHCYCKGEASGPGFLEDYAFLTQGLLDLYEAQFNFADLEIAIHLTEKQSELFEDRGDGAFFSAAADPSLVLRVKDSYDGAEPAGSSVAAMNLLRLARMTGRVEFRESAERTLAAFASRLALAPVAIPQMLTACEFLLGEQREIILAGRLDSAEMRALVRELHTRFVPNRVVLLVDSVETQRALACGIPSVASMNPVEGRAKAYVCRDYTCQLPVSEPARFAELIQC